MATFSSIIGVVTLSFSVLIYEFAPLWLFLDLIGIVCAYIGLKDGDKNCKTGLILCGLAAFFSSTSILLVYLAGR